MVYTHIHAINEVWLFYRVTILQEKAENLCEAGVCQKQSFLDNKAAQ